MEKWKNSPNLLNWIYLFDYMISDPPRFIAEDIEGFKTPVIVKKGQKATFKLPFIGREPKKIQWYLDGEELSEESNIKIENSEGCCRLLLNKLQRKQSGEVKLKIKNEFGSVEAYSQLLVLGNYMKHSAVYTLIQMYF